MKKILMTIQHQARWPSQDSAVEEGEEVISVTNQNLPVLNLSQIISASGSLWKFQGGRNAFISIPEAVEKNTKICIEN